MYLVDNGSREFGQEVEFEGVGLRGHEIRRDHCPQLGCCQYWVGLDREEISTHDHNVAFVAFVSLNWVSVWARQLEEKAYHNANRLVGIKSSILIRQ